MKTFCTSLAAVALGALIAPQVLAEDAARTISVSGEGKAAARPDIATINTGVVTQAASAGDALAANNKSLERIMEVLKVHKIASKDIQTSNFDVRPEYRRGPRGQQQMEIVGHRVTNQVRVRVRNLPDLGKVLDSLVKAGSNQISGISFGIDDALRITNKARGRAIQDGRSRAELFAGVADVRVGKVLSISERPIQVPRPQFMGRAMAAEAASVPVATGEQEVRVTVHMVFALQDLE